MSYRYMRVIVFFDLPTITSQDIKNYNKFRKTLIKEGFIMLQESVYCKLALNMSVVNSIKSVVIGNAPLKGNIQMLIITEKQFASILYVSGSMNIDKENSTDRLLIL